MEIKEYKTGDTIRVRYKVTGIFDRAFDYKSIFLKSFVNRIGIDCFYIYNFKENYVSYLTSDISIRTSRILLIEKGNLLDKVNNSELRNMFDYNIDDIAWELESKL